MLKKSYGPLFLRGGSEDRYLGITPTFLGNNILFVATISCKNILIVAKTIN